MQDCEYYLDLCSLALDDELTAAEQAELTAHLSICPSCADYMNALRGMQQQLAAAVPTPSSLHEDIMELVLSQAQAQARPTPRRFIPVFSILAAAAATVMLVMTGTLGDWFHSGGVSTAGGAAGAPAELMIEGGAAQNATADIQSFAAPADAPPSAANDAPMQARIDAAPEAQNDSAAIDAGVEVTPEKRIVAAPEGAVSASPTDGASIVLQQRDFAACYVAQGSGIAPEIDGSLVAESADGTTLYFALQNNLSDLEQALGVLSKAGYEAEKRDDVKDVAIDAKADTVLLIVIQGS